MKLYVLLSVVCCVLVLLMPLPLLPESTPDPTVGTGATDPVTTTTTSSPDKPAETIKILDASAGVIYTFALRDFLIYTVAAEMPASYRAEALKAQTVATYTYYMYEKQHNAGDAALQGADSKQVPGSFPKTYSPEGLREQWGEDYDRYLRVIASAVDSVLGKVMTFEGDPIMAVYHSGNWGRTETAGVVWGYDQPYLQSVVSTGDTASPSCESTVTVSDEDFAVAFGGLTGEAADWIQGEPVRSEAGSVTSLTVGGTAYTGRQIREKLGLRSACFTVTHGADGFTFRVQGHGHGVGMSQIGANAMAEQGFSYEEILHHYYTGITIE